MLAPSVKTKSENSNYYNLKIRMCFNGSEDSKYKSLSTFSPACSGDSVRFTVSTCAYFLLWMSVVDIVHFFQSSMRDESDKLCMDLPPYHK